ncbi:MAG: RNA methyltransferase [Chloroflexi bacterium]|nr:RNA methyltransferase [Chloroflexota bacterium]
MPQISSPHNERVKLVRLLQRQAKTRRQQRRLVLEGLRLVRDVVQAGVPPDFACYTPDALQDQAVEALVRGLEAQGVPCFEVPDILMREMSDTETPQGVLGVFRWPALPVPEAPDLVVVADGWRDPGNLGTLLRTAAAAGVSVVALTPGTVDPFNPKTLRAGMSAQYRVPLLSLDWPALAKRFGALPFYLADAGGELRYDAVDWTRRAVLVIGGEAHGFAQAAGGVPHTLIRIPMASGIESLNAAVAASILIYAARRHAFEA